MVTIRAVARAAGVSTATVSRVMNGSPSISPETREKVMKTVKELGFVPNVSAKNLSQHRTGTIGLLLNIENSRAYSNPFFAEVLHGIETVVYSEGYFLLIANERTISRHNISIDHLALEKRIDGLILPYPSARRGLIRTLYADGFPFVVIGEPDESRDKVDFVDIDNELGGRQAVDHLVECGYRRIAFLGGDRRVKFIQSRLAGYAAALRQHGLPFRDELVLEERGAITRETGQALAHKALSLAAPPDALLCTDNMLAWGALGAASVRGLRVPHDVGIVSFDNYPLAEYLEPPLTTIDIDVFALGTQAASVLLRRLKTSELPSQQGILSTRLITRGSTSRKPPVAGPVGRTA